MLLPPAFQFLDDVAQQFQQLLIGEGGDVDLGARGGDDGWDRSGAGGLDRQLSSPPQPVLDVGHGVRVLEDFPGLGVDDDVKPGGRSKQNLEFSLKPL